MPAKSKTIITVKCLYLFQCVLCFPLVVTFFHCKEFKFLYNNPNAALVLYLARLSQVLLDDNTDSFYHPNHHHTICVVECLLILSICGTVGIQCEAYLTSLLAG